MFQRIGAAAFKKDLTNTLILCEKLGNPQNKFKSVHIAGTNGKGSTAHSIASVLQEAGYKTGLYTSPHLKSFRERIRINGHEVEEQYIVNFVETNSELIEEVNPSFFELTVVMAFDYFAVQNVDVAVMEVGMGGRLDSTNVITPELSVITNISFDHQAFLGDTLPLIAGEKAGIIKNTVPVVISYSQPDIADVFKRVASEKGSEIYFADQNIKIDTMSNNTDNFMLADIKSINGNLLLQNLEFGLTGNYQKYNLPGIIQSFEILRNKGFKINEESLRAGLRNVVSNTGLKGRWQVLKNSPKVICDTGHNEDGIRNIVQHFNTISYNKLHFILGVVNDKKLDDVLVLLPKKAIYYFTQANIPRALPASDLQKIASSFGLRGQVVPEVSKAYEIALSSAGAEDLIFIGGSTFTVAEIPDL
jgi:dihydrofolate synthase / folylpolyglutamate synthase